MAISIPDLDLDARYDQAKSPETETRKVPFPFFCRSAIAKKHPKCEFRRAFGHIAPVKLPIVTLYATQEHVSPIGVERFVILAMAGMVVPPPVVIHFEGKYVIYEGHHRLTALFDLGADIVEIHLADLGGSLWTPDGG